ncbi:MAG: type II toxin-antitoxin system VapC family toxin [Candidatus Acidiferrales bacterium]
MSAAVVDASVAAKWLLPRAGETLVEEAARVLARHSSGEDRLVVPDLFWAEIGNILWKAVRRNRCSKRAAQASLQLLQEYGLRTFAAGDDLLALAFEVATEFDRTFYDSLYVALAIHVKVELITADERLANALAARLPVKWLGAL